MLDPITALGIAGNVVQFIDFGLKVTSKAREIHRDGKGKTAENADLEIVSRDLVALSAQLYASVGSSGETEALEELCGRCAKTAGELLSALQSFTVSGKRTKWKSTREALKSLWGREKVEEIKKRLLDFRGELKIHFLVRLKDELDLIALQQSNRFNELDDKSKAVLVELIASRETLSQTLREHQATVQMRHLESQDLVANEHIETRSQVFGAVNAAATSIDTQIQLMRKEIAVVNNAMAKNKLDTSRLLEEIRVLAQALLSARTDKKRRKLQEKSNLAAEALCALMSVYNTLTTLLQNLRARAAALMASVGFALLWKSQEDSSTPFSFQRNDSSTSLRPRTQEENEHVRQRRTAVLCSNYYYYYFPLSRRRHIIRKDRVLSDLKGIHPVDPDVQAQFPNLPLLLDLTNAEWRPNFAWAVKDAIELPFLFHLPTPSVAYDFLSIAIAFSAIMPHITSEAYAENIIADLFGNSTHLSSPPGSAQRQRIKNDYNDWKKIAGLLFLDESYITCHEQSCQLWKVDQSRARLLEVGPDTDAEPLLVKFWLWLMSGWQTCFSFKLSANPPTSTCNVESVIVYSVAEFLLRSSYHISLKVERSAKSGDSLIRIYFTGAQDSLRMPAPAVVQQRRQEAITGY